MIHVMSSWSAKRKLTYLIIFCVFVLLIVVVPLYFIAYEKPSCFDGKENGDETGVDCGGSCQLLCSFEAIKPNILWSRSFKVSSGVYSSTAYIENHNISSESLDARYIFKLYDAQNNLIASREGRAYIPKNKVFAIFEPNIQVGDSIPARTTFEFVGDQAWMRVTDAPPELVVRRKSISNVETFPRIDATIENRSLQTQTGVEVVAIVYDGKDNAVGASRTFIDSLMRDEAQDVVFTWPLPFETQDAVCKIPADVMLVIDRSGSMASDGTNPPQPLTKVKEAAVQFVNQLEEDDQAGLVSYAGEASQPIDAVLTPTLSTVVGAINAIAIRTDGLQQTNIADGIFKAFEELNSSNGRSIARKIIIALTDGVPTRPIEPGNEAYPQTAALAAAQQAKNAQMQIYTIGLGANVGQDFLENLATSPDHYFPAVTSDSLGAVYKEIATSICKDTPTSIEIIPIVQKGL